MEGVCEASAGQRGGRSGDTEARAGELSAFVEQARPGLYVWGAETTMKLPRFHGTGGRCRHLALAVAERLKGRGGWALLAAGTDGWDGSDAVAGACVDGDTAERGKRRGRDTREDLRRADSGGFFSGSGEEIVTGPTGTNVNDLLILLKR